MSLKGLQGVKLVSVLGVLAAGFMMSSAAQRSGMAALHVDPGSPNRVIPPKSSATTPGLSSLPLSAQSAIAATVGRDDAAYHAVADGKSFHASNPNHGFSADFTRDGVQFRTGTAHWGIRLKGYGYGSASIAMHATAPQAKANRVEYRRGTMTEWYINGPLGLEQGFTLTAPPAKSVGTPLTLALGLSGDLTASLDPAGKTLTLAQAGRASALRYRGLVASDAIGRDLRAWLELKDNDLLIRVDDHDARYPIVVDPFVQLAKLTTSDMSPYLGGVAISGDTIVVGSGRSIPSAAYLFIKPASGWTTLTESVKLTTSDGGPGGFSNAYTGTSVAISAGGDTVLVGAPGFFKGAVYVFVRPAGGWVPMTESAKLTASDEAPTAHFEFGDALTFSGDTVVAGAPLQSQGSLNGGAAYLFVKPAGGWVSMTETVRLTGVPPSAGFRGYFGFSAAISGDTLIVGNWCDDRGGSAYVFVKPSGGWAMASAFAARLIPSYAPPINFGCSIGIAVALSNDGGTAFVLDDNAYAVDIFLKPSSGWASITESARLTTTDGSDLGGSLALSGGTLVVGTESSETAYVFLKPDSGWATTSAFDSKLTAADGIPGSFGTLNMVGTTGDTVVVGSPFGGAAYVFGLVVTCDDNNPCTDDSGDPSTGCVHANNAALCDDGNPNTALDACSGGICAGVDNCIGVICTATDPCHVAGVCVDHATGACSTPLKSCNDNNPCTDDSCNPASGCIYTNNIASCNDGNPNTSGDVCSGGLCGGVDHCVGVVCAAIDPCHEAGVCVDHATGACSTPLKSCNDNNPCTDDSCNPAVGCVYTNNATSCNDGNPNTTGDVCSGGFCGGVDHCIGVICTPLDQCHDAGVCVDHATGACTNPNKLNGAVCNDHNACTVNDTCTNGVCGHLVGAPLSHASGSTCGIRTDGRLVCWGNDDSLGQLSGPNSSHDSYIAVSTGHGVTCAVRVDGRLACWGFDSFGQVSGPNATPDRFTAVNDGIGSSTCALRVDGRLVCWGYDFGQISGPNASVDRYMSLSGDDSSTCAVRLDGRLNCWGVDYHGLVPGPSVLGPNASLDSYTAVSTNSVLTCALRVDGRLACWGLDQDLSVSGPNASPDSYTAVTVGTLATCALRADGRLKCWGVDRDNGVSGPNASPDSYIAVSEESPSTCALRVDGRIVCWGTDYGDVSGPNASTDTFGVVQGNPLDCNDNNPCTDDSCNSSTGCVHTNITGTCDDGNPNTIGDVCFGGICAGINRCAGVICAPADQCHNAGVCDSLTGLCSAGMPKQNGTACNDGNACTHSDTCQAGSCVGASPVTCTALDQCHDAGVCNSGTGICSNPIKVNGAACSDGNACTQTDTCQASVCQGTNYSWSGVLQPVNADGSSIFKLGSTVPVKFQLTTPCVPTGTFTAKIFLAKVTSDILGSEVEATSTSAADTGNTFRYDASGDQYIYNLATKTFTNGNTTPLSAGTWQIRIAQYNGTTEIGTVGTVIISLKK